MDPLQKKIENMKHCASPSLARCYDANKEKPQCMKINGQNHAECCLCQEACCTVELPKFEHENQTEL